MADACELLDGFLAAELPEIITNALIAFLSAPLPAVCHSSWMPPADEVATRQDLAQQLRQNIMAAVNKKEFDFTAMQMAAFLLIPMDNLRGYVETTGRDVRWKARLQNALSLLAHLDTMRDIVRYFLQGQHPDAERKKRKTPGQEPQPFEQSCTSDPVEGEDFVRRNEKERRQCLARDQNTCLFTHTVLPETCHIVPFAFNSTTTNLMVYTKRFINAFALLFCPDDDDDMCRNLIDANLGCSDKHWNMLSINPYLHALWAKPYWAIQCLGIESSSDTAHSVVLAFHWMPRRLRERNPDRKIRLDAGAGDFQDMLDALVGEGSYGEGPVPGMQGFANALQNDCFRPIVSGQKFRVMLDTLDDAIKMRKMVDVQWAIVRLAAMSGAAGPDDLADEFSEFDFEREAYERKQFLDSLDAARDE